MLSKKELVKLYIDAIKLKHKEEPESMVFEFKYFEKIIEESNLTKDFIRNSALHCISEPTQEGDEDFIEAALFLIEFLGEPSNWIDILNKLVIDKNHQRHEDIVHSLQHYKNPKSVQYLKGIIDLKEDLSYLDYDDYGAFYKQCFFALRDIGTKDAFLTILGYFDSNNEILREEANLFVKEFDIKL